MNMYIERNWIGHIGHKKCKSRRLQTRWLEDIKILAEHDWIKNTMEMTAL